MPAMAVRRSPRRSRSRRPSSTTRRLPDGPSEGAFELANRWSISHAEGLDHVFFTNSGSESVDTALKIALAYHRAKGKGSRTRLIGRERGYHGVGFGGISVGGIVNNRKMFGTMLPASTTCRHTHDLPATPSPRASRSTARTRRRRGAHRRAA
jgi:adenosylmethionine-8-amino-7-oxononanoate aminotransferase